MGSPPHARGKGPGGEPPAPRTGITPARAGKRRIAALSAAGTTDHPRTRGEKISHPLKISKNLGSPPHARGKDPVCNWFSWCAGITPARAGKRYKDKATLEIMEDHPRTRGEKLGSQPISCPHPGSPPHARGKDHYRWRVGHPVGITPARAGKSGSKALRQSWSEDHPRTRGEKFLLLDFSGCCLGSPPHARGKGSF